MEEGNIGSLLWVGECDGPLRISIGNTLVAQVCFLWQLEQKDNHVNV
jgi:hypothetical protein